jgi:hypothetical protein
MSETVAAAQRVLAAAYVWRYALVTPGSALVSAELELVEAVDELDTSKAYELDALAAAQARIAKLEAAFEQVARSRNEWRARAKREPAERSGFELCSHPRTVPRLPCAACAPRYAAEAERRSKS